MKASSSRSVVVMRRIANASSRHFLGLVLLLSLVVGPYLTFQEIEDALGKGMLFRLLWERPTDEPGIKR